MMPTDRKNHLCGSESAVLDVTQKHRNLIIPVKWCNFRAC